MCMIAMVIPAIIMKAMSKSRLTTTAAKTQTGWVLPHTPLLTASAAKVGVG